MKNEIINQLIEANNIISKIVNDNDIVSCIENVSNACISTLLGGGKILIAGNGGSAADAQHIAGELVSRFNYNRPGLSAVALTTDTSIITAIGNDYGYERLFSRQIEAIGREGDIFLGYSTSGSSKNIILGLETARKMRIRTVGFTGNREGLMDNMCDYIIKIPSSVTPKIQEGHLIVGHIMCGIIEKSIYPDPEQWK
jgi:D-sedoheptulose 7-phosphate isomerase